MAQLGFSAEGVERTGTYEIIPVGDYPAMIIGSTMKHPKGQFDQPDTSKPAYLELSIEIIDGEFKGRRLTDRLNLNNPNEMTRRIAKGTLANICDAQGIGGVGDSSELHMKPMIVKVGVKPANGQYGPGNEVKGYKAFAQSAPVQAATAQVQSQSKPWG